ncbi:MAG: hypothetical protein JNK82_13830 [Myxococcaceae bacterium]|nr:hypothetical protein [Myxococcaceae bacterium]
MSDPTLPDLPPHARAVLSKVEAPEPPEGAQERVFGKLAASIAAGAVVGASASAAAASTSGAGASAAGAGVATKLVVVIAAGSVAAGLAGGTMLGRTVLAPEPVVVEKVRTVEKVVEVPAAPAPPPEPEPVPEPEPAPKRPAADTLLARERELLDAARAALMKGDGAAALDAADRHSKQFPRGRLAEERESLAVQALVAQKNLSAARERAAAFHHKYPKSLLGATIDAALPP